MIIQPPLHLLRAETRAGASPLVLVHSINGDPQVYAPLASKLAWPGAIIALDGLTPPESLRALASGHVDALRRAGLRGPWYLGGWAAGGVIASEIAAQLVDAREHVRVVAAFDSRVPAPEMRSRPMDDASLAGPFVDQITRTLGMQVKRRPASHEARELLAVLAEVDAVPPGWDEALTAQRFASFAATVRAFFRHDPRRLDMPVALFEAQEAHPQHPKPPTLGWEPYVNDLTRAPIPGSHFTLLLPQHASQLAAILDETLARAAAASPTAG